MTTASRVAVLAVLGAALGLAIPLPACTDAASAPRRAVLRTRLTAGDALTRPYLNAAGWTITLRRLAVATGTFRYYDGAAAFARARPAPRRDRPIDHFDRWLGVRAAYAHPPGYTEGNLLGSMEQPHSADLARGDVTLPSGSGAFATYHSGTFGFSPGPPVGPGAAALEGHAVLVEASATKGAETRIFTLTADAPELLDADGVPQIEGCLFKTAKIERDGTVVVTVAPSVWLSRIDFTPVPVSADGKAVALGPDAFERRVFARSVKDGVAYGFAYEADP